MIKLLELIKNRKPTDAGSVNISPEKAFLELSEIDLEVAYKLYTDK